MNIPEFRLAIVQALVEVASENYKENSRIAGVLDDKAQKTGALAGVFLAGSFAFIKTENFGQTAPLNRLAGLWGLLFLAVCIGLLLVTTILSLRTMWIRAVPAPMSLAIMEKMSLDLLEASDEDLDNATQENFFRDQSRVWSVALQKQHAANANKAKYLRASQLTLAVAIICGAAILLEILGKVMYYRLA